MIELSIIIPVYNVKQYLAACIESVAESASGHEAYLEVILVDDGSTDGSGEIANELSAKYDYMTVLHQENQGVAAARNAGIHRAKGQWIYVIDSDDWVTPRCICVILEAVRSNPEAEILLFDAWKNTQQKEMPWNHFRQEGVFREEDGEGRRRLHSIRQQVLYPAGTPLAAPWDKVYRLSFLKKNSIFFNENLKVLDDMIFNMEAFGKARLVVYRKEKIYHYRHVETSITNSYRPDRVSRDMAVWEYIERYMEKLNYEEDCREQIKDLIQSYYCRVIKSFSICCRLCFFHPLNENQLPQKLSEVRRVMELKPYRKAFRTVRAGKLEWRLKLVWLMVRCHSPFGIYLLHQMNQWKDKHGR